MGSQILIEKINNFDISLKSKLKYELKCSYRTCKSYKFMSMASS